MNDNIFYFKHDDPGFGIWFNLAIVDDYYFTLSRLKQNNKDRKRNLMIVFKVYKYELHIFIPIKTIGDKK